MRQETGSNLPQRVIMISVRPVSGGDHFLIDDYIDALHDRKEITLKVELLTKRVMLVPKEILSNGSAKEQVESIGMTISGDEEVVVIEDRDIAALVALPSQLVAQFEEHFGGRYEFTTPILHRPVISEPHVILDVCDDIAFVKVYSKGWNLEFADSYETSSTALVLYWMQRLSAVMNLSRHSLYIYRGDAALGRLMRKNFKSILYANNKR